MIKVSDSNYTISKARRAKFTGTKLLVDPDYKESTVDEISYLTKNADIKLTKFADDKTVGGIYTSLLILKVENVNVFYCAILEEKVAVIESIVESVSEIVEEAKEEILQVEKLPEIIETIIEETIPAILEETTTEPLAKEITEKVTSNSNKEKETVIKRSPQFTKSEEDRIKLAVTKQGKTSVNGTLHDWIMEKTNEILKE